MFSIRVDAADVDWQIRLIQQFPDIADRHFKPAMNDAVGRLAREIEPNIPSQRATAEFKDRVSGRGMRLTGRVGWWGSVSFWQINILEYGAPAHIIRMAWGRGPVPHPGFPGKHFMKRADEATRQQNVERFEQARDKTVSDMTVKGGL